MNVRNGMVEHGLGHVMYEGTDCMYNRAELRSKLSGWNMNAMVDTLALFKTFGIPASVKSNMRATDCEGGE
jgi:hypothetical protein